MGRKEGRKDGGVGGWEDGRMNKLESNDDNNRDILQLCNVI